MQKDPKRFQTLLDEWNESKQTVTGNYEYLKNQNGEYSYDAADSSSQLEEYEHIGLSDEIDHKILMHRDAHFGGDFEVMLEYYDEQHVGVHPDLDLERIQYLKEVEEGLGKNLSSILLSPQEIQLVEQAKRAYASFKEVYEKSEVELPIAYAISNLILSEEEEPVDEIEAVVALGERIVPELIQLIKNEEYFSPLFPGYGYAPHLAAQCLGLIGSPEAVPFLFEMFSKELEFDEVVILEALTDIGESARDFLLNILRSRPLTSDNIHAAFALTNFVGDLTVATAALDALFDPQVQAKPLLTTYLFVHFESLRGTDQQSRVLELAKDPSLTSHLRGDLQHLLSEWA